MQRVGYLHTPERGRTRLEIQLSPAPNLFLLHSSPLNKMLSYTPRRANAKASRLLPYPPSIVQSRLHSAWAALLLQTLHSHCLCPPILRVLLSCLILKEVILTGDNCAPREIFGNVGRNFWLSWLWSATESSWIEAGAAAKHPTMHRTAPRPPTPPSKELALPKCQQLQDGEALHLSDNVV